MICVERPAGIGEAAEVLHSESNPFAATIGLRIEPAPVGSGVEFRLDVDPRSAPLYVYKTFGRSARAWPGTSAMLCVRVSPAGRSPTAS